MTEHSHQHPGSCDCGAVEFTYFCSLPVEQLQPRACQCEYCLPAALSYLSEPGARLEVRAKDSRYLYAHSFGTGTADFMHCAVCNHPVYVRSEIEGHCYALVVAPALEAWPLAVQPEAVDYDGESLQDRLSRRSDRWIREMEFVVFDR